MHDLIVDTELIHTDDGEPQPRSSNFVECLDMNCEWCHGDLIILDNEIANFINNAEAKLRAAEHRLHLTAFGVGMLAFLATTNGIFGGECFDS